MLRLTKGIVLKSKCFLSTEVSVEDKIRVGCIIFWRYADGIQNGHVIERQKLDIISIFWIIFLLRYNYFQSILKFEFEPTFSEVKDVSGGCGAMFDISVESHKFKVKDTIIFLLTLILFHILYYIYLAN